MATIIDALIVTLGLDPKQFKKGAKEATDAQDKLAKGSKKSLTDAEKSAKSAGEQVAKFRNEVLRTVAAVVGLSAIKSFVASVTQSDAALGRMSRNVGESTQMLSAWEGVSARAGGSAESMAGDIKGLVQQVQRFSLTGEGGEAFRFFRSIGIAVTDAAGKIRPMTDVLLEVADKFQGMDPAKAQAIGAGMGFSEGTVNTLLMGRTALRAMLDEQARANVRTPEDTKSAIARDNAWKLLVGTFSRLATTVLNFVTPALVGLMNVIRNHAGVAATLISGVAIALTALSVVRFVGLISQLAQLSGALRGVGTAAATAGAAGGAGAAMGVLGKVGLAGAAVGTGLELWNLGDALKQWWDISHREGVKVSARTAAGGGAGGGGTSDQATYLTSLEQQFGLPAGLLDSVWKQESGRGKKKFNPKSGATGDFQQMPATAKAYGIVDPMDFGQSAMGAARMYRDLLKQYKGDLPMALAAYNEGSGNLAKRGMGNLPNETSGYIASIMGRMPGGGGGGGSTSTSTSSVATVGQVTIVTQSKDAQGIARDLRQVLEDQHHAANSNAGLVS